MPTALFFELNDEKKQTIITAGLSEFADYGFENSSTNRIVKKAGISKGSLFKYFPTKEDFYFYILDKITAELISGLKERANTLPTELCQRIIAYSVLEFSWYIQYPEKSKMIIKAFAKSDTEIYKKTLLKYGSKEQDLYYWFMKDVDTAQFRWDRQKTLEIIKWFLKGFNEDFLSQIQIQGNSDFETIRQEYTASLSEHLEILKTGLGK
ncbi:MAG: TetR/AcrR family transcriptional regulator [Lachnospiraceae bacterium]|nr:TetR/AcrR family transcriptional regulator [Lachnospiraceae bacterium]